MGCGIGEWWGGGGGWGGAGWGTPAHARPPSAASTRARPALHACLPPDKHARSRATHVCRLNERLLRVGWAGVRLWGGLAHPLTHARPALRTCLPPSKRTRSRVTSGGGGGVGVGVGVGVGSGVARPRSTAFTPPT